MIAFLVGLVVIVMMGAVSLAGFLLFPLLLVLGVFLRLFIAVFLCLFVIWLIGKSTLLLIEYLRKPKE